MKGVLNQIKKPSLNNEKLAYETGYHLGDGHLGLYKNSTYQIVYAGNLIEDEIFFRNILIPLLEELYGLKTEIVRHRTKSSIRITIYSKMLFDFKRVIGLPVGKKTALKSIPEFINISKENRLNFIAGVFDSDGCIKFLKKHKDINYYPQARIRLKNLVILEFIRNILMSFDISSTLYEEVIFDKRYNKFYQRWCLDINGKHNVESFFNKIKPKNIRHLSKYIIWKKYGYCEPKTDIYKRLEMY